MVGLITLIILYRTWWTSIFLKKQEVLMVYHRRYTDLLNDVEDVKTPEKAYSYYRNFWSLNHEEFSFWRRGLIPNDTYRYWLQRRKDEQYNKPFKKDVLPCYNCGWEKFKVAFKGSDYEKFFNKLLSGEDIDCLMDKYGPRKMYHWIPFIFPPPKVKIDDKCSQKKEANS